MKFCTKCGQQIMDDAAFCIHCGCSIEGKKDTEGKNNIVEKKVIQEEKGTDFKSAFMSNLGMLILGFFIPLAGLIICIVKKDTKMDMAVAAGKGALLGFAKGVVDVITYILFYIVVFLIVGVGTSLRF